MGGPPGDSSAVGGLERALSSLDMANSPRPPTKTSLIDLPDDILYHIGLFLEPPPATVEPHWHTFSTGPLPSFADTRSFRASCRSVAAAVAPPPLGLDFPLDRAALASAGYTGQGGERDLDAIEAAADSLNMRMGWWAHTPRHVLSRLKRIRFPESMTLMHTDYISPQLARQAMLDFTLLLSRAPALATVEIFHNPFCAHDAYGRGEYRECKLRSATAAAPLHLPSVRTLVVGVKCRVCAIHLATMLSAACPNLTSLRCALMRGAPLTYGDDMAAAQYLPAGTRVPAGMWAPYTLLPLAARSLTALTLKVDEGGVVPFAFLTNVLRSLAPCQRLQELYVSQYGGSRKIEVVHHVMSLQPGGTHDDWLLNTAEQVDRLFDVLAAFPELQALDLCVGPRTIMPSVPHAPHASSTFVERLEWREGAMRAARVMADRSTVTRGWWWVQVSDLDYSQLERYERWAWWIGHDGEVEMDETPQRLRPMVVRNQDGQGTVVDIPSEAWN